jgi:hypothetical protein
MYRLIWRVNPQDRTKKKLYAVPVLDGTISKNDSKIEMTDVFSISLGCLVIEIIGTTEPTNNCLCIRKSVGGGEFSAPHYAVEKDGADDAIDTYVDFCNARNVWTNRTLNANSYRSACISKPLDLSIADNTYCAA